MPMFSGKTSAMGTVISKRVSIKVIRRATLKLSKAPVINKSSSWATERPAISELARKLSNFRDIIVLSIRGLPCYFLYQLCARVGGPKMIEALCDLFFLSLSEGTPSRYVILLVRPVGEECYDKLS